MIFPKLSISEKKKSFIQAFKGINFGTRIGEDEFADTLNLTSDEYPVLATRKRRTEASYINADDDYTGYFCGFQGDGTRFARVIYNEADGALLYVYDRVFEIDDMFNIDLERTNDERQLLFFGAYVLVYPDNCYINLIEAIEEIRSARENFELNGNTLVSELYGNYKPYDRSNNTWWRKAAADSGKMRGPLGTFTIQNFTRDSNEVVRNALVYNQEDFYTQLNKQDFPTSEHLIIMIDSTSRVPTTSGLWSSEGKMFTYWPDTGNHLLKISWENGDRPIFYPGNIKDYIARVDLNDKGGVDIVYEGENYILIKGIIPYHTIEITDGVISKIVEYAHTESGDCSECFYLSNFERPTGQNVTAKLFVRGPQNSFVSLDHRVVCQNRLWGCRCGENAEGKTVNEIYCTALGTFDSFEVYDGIASDSWSVTVGSPGMFTGAAVIGQNPVFFKENSVIKVYVSASGAHQVVETNMRGVQLGSHKSIVYMNEMLVYKACDGVVVYGGTSVTSIFNAFADRYYCNAVAGGYGSKYVMYCEDKDGKGYIFVYDFKYGIWHRESLHNAPGLIERGTVPKIIDITTEGNRVLLAAGNGHIIYDGEKQGGGLGVTEAPFPYLLETGDIGFSTADSKEISRIDLRYSLGIGSIMRVYVKYDSEEWVNIYSAEGQKAAPGTVSLPIIPRLCDHFRIRVSGVGEFKLYGIAKEYREISN